jgi:hypothetical protein
MPEINKHKTVPQCVQTDVSTSFPLVSMTDFTLNQWDGVAEIYSFKDMCVRCYDYAQFLKQPLKLWMFVPCDEEDNYLREPYEKFAEDGVDFENYMIYYIEQREKCLFGNNYSEVFDVALAKVYLDEYTNIEQLSNEIRCIQLTTPAISQLKLNAV